MKNHARNRCAISETEKGNRYVLHPINIRGASHQGISVPSNLKNRPV